MRRTKKLDDGYALVSVIWICGLLAVLATAFLATTTSQIRGLQTQAARLRLEHAANDMIHIATLHLLEANGDISKVTVPRNCTWDKGVFLETAYQDHGGLVDINTANPILLRALLKSVLRDTALTEKAMQQVTDFKDADTTKPDGGPERVDYQPLGLAAKNLPFQTTFELDQIPILTGEKATQLTPFVTVHSQQMGVDLTVLAPGLAELFARDGIDVQGVASPSAHRIFSIAVEARDGNGARLGRRAIINLLLQPDRPFAILEWTSFAPKAQAGPISDLGTPCLTGKSE